MTSLDHLRHQTRNEVHAVANDPQGRYQLRVVFYQNYGFGHLNRAGYGESELDFLQWEIKRGVLNPLDHPQQPGSPWWRDVNLGFLYWAQLAGKIVAANLADPSGVGHQVQLWLDYIHQPSARSWYRAHNGSIIQGYLDCLAQAHQEDIHEQFFINQVLYRVCFAECMELGGPLRKLAANPKFLSVDAMVHMHDFYPIHYPLTPKDVKHIQGQGHGLEEWMVRLMDNTIVLPHITEIYRAVAQETGSPGLMRCLTNGAPSYPNLGEPPSV